MLQEQHWNDSAIGNGIGNSTPLPSSPENLWHSWRDTTWEKSNTHTQEPRDLPQRSVSRSVKRMKEPFPFMLPTPPLSSRSPNFPSQHNEASEVLEEDPYGPVRIRETTTHPGSELWQPPLLPAIAFKRRPNRNEARRTMMNFSWRVDCGDRLSCCTSLPDLSSQSGTQSEELRILSHYAASTHTCHDIQQAESDAKHLCRCLVDQRLSRTCCGFCVDDAGNAGKLFRSLSPRRQLSYGESLRTQRRAPLHRTAGSRELRSKAGWMGVDKDCTSWITKILKTSESIEPPANHTTTRNSLPPCEGLSHAMFNDDSKIEEAHLATLTTPTRPRVITISSRNSSTVPDQSVSPYRYHATLTSSIGSYTPPATPQDTQEHCADSNRVSWKEAKIDHPHSRCTRGKSPITPPKSPTPVPTKKTASDMTTLPPRYSQAQTQAPKGYSDYRSDDVTSTWILRELGCLIAKFPLNKLQLDSPIIRCIRSTRLARIRRLTSDHSSAGPKSTVPRSAPFRAPHSRYSSMRPLSNHPVRSQDYPDSPSTESQTTNRHPSRPTHDYLRIIFPRVSHQVLETLHAYYIALNYVTDISPSSPTPLPSSLSSPKSPLALPPCCSASTIPAKARATLGIHFSSPSPSPSTSWLRPQTPEVDEETQWSVEEIRDGLTNVIGCLVSEMLGGGLGVGEDALVSAVGQVVRMAEAGDG